MPYFKFVEPTDNGVALRWGGRGRAASRALRREGRGSRWLCWRFGRGQLEVGRRIGNIFTLIISRGRGGNIKVLSPGAVGILRF